jgi:hypothetical protein
VANPTFIVFMLAFLSNPSPVRLNPRAGDKEGGLSTPLGHLKKQLLLTYSYAGSGDPGFYLIFMLAHLFFSGQSNVSDPTPQGRKSKIGQSYCYL